MTASDTLVLDAAEKLFRECCTKDEIERADAGHWPRMAWSDIEGFGLPLAMVAEEHGGIGLSLIDAFAIVRLAGRAALPLPVAETMVANRLLACAGLAVGTEPLTIADGRELILTRQEDGWHLAGMAKRVPWGRSCAVVTAVEFGDTLQIVSAGHAAIVAHQGSNIANEPRDRLRFDCALPGSAVRPLVGVDAFALLAAARCCQMAGAIEAIADLTIAYALDREQFGRPIAKFQAVQQQIAVMAELTAAARAAADMASEAAGERPMRRLAVAAAKARIGEAGGTIAAIAHQVHGAIGFTEEYRLHHLTRRLWSWREEYGNESFWNRELGRAMAKSGSDGLWAALTQV